MSHGGDRTKRTESQAAKPWEEWMSCGPSGSGMAECCSSSVREMAGYCPCGAALKKHRFMFFTALAGIALTFLIGVTGSILGIIAFFRTI